MAETPSEKASLFKVVLMANQRKAALTGLDGLEIKIRKEVTVLSSVDIVARVETEHGLAPGALEIIGRQAARALSGATLELAPPMGTGGTSFEKVHASPTGHLKNERCFQTPPRDSVEAELEDTAANETKERTNP